VGQEEKNRHLMIHFIFDILLFISYKNVSACFPCVIQISTFWQWTYNIKSDQLYDQHLK